MSWPVSVRLVSACTFERVDWSCFPSFSLLSSSKAAAGFGWGSEGDGVIEMTGTFTRHAIAGVEGVWMRPSTQVVTLRFRRAAGGGGGGGGDGEGLLEGYRREQEMLSEKIENGASAGFHSRPRCLSAALALS